MSDLGLRKIATQLSVKLERDVLIQGTVHQLRKSLQVDRVVLYYFYCEWQGQVTFESLSDATFSILGKTGADDCFNGEYADLYLAGRVRAIPDVEKEPIADCHRDFLRSIQVRANLAVPVLNNQRLWGLLVAHHCREPRPWSESEIATLQKGAETLATAPAIAEN